jgi:hypothetical protein
MPSRSFIHWQTAAKTALDHLEEAYRSIAVSPRARRRARQQLTQAYLLMLSSHFQQCCRGLHTEAVEYLLVSLGPAQKLILRTALTDGRKLDHGNPNPSNLGADFGRLGMSLWPAIAAVPQRGRRRDRQGSLQHMGTWRNAIAHQDFGRHATALHHRTALTLREVRGFRRGCDRLAVTLDHVVLAHLKTVIGPTATW